MDNEKICPKYEAAVALLNKKWTGLILSVLMDGPKRFTDLSEMICGMSDRMLAERFKELEANGILERKVYPETPVRIEYELTEKGKCLKPIVDEIKNWAWKWIE